jgi:hypothetical protein
MRVYSLALLLAVFGGVAAQGVPNTRRVNCISTGFKVSNTGLKSASQINSSIAFDQVG